MNRIAISGGACLKGSVEISGMKNAALPIIYATVLVEGKCTIENVPDVSDIAMSIDILEGMGAEITHIDKNTVEIDTTDIVQGSSDPELVRKIRASYYLLGAELGRFGAADVAFPGGCDFGGRPIDQHIKGFEKLGGTVEATNKRVTIETEDGLVGTHIYMDIVSVGATINVMLAATLAEGTTVIENAAREPHIVDLANFLNTCGAKISGAGTDIIKIRGVNKLHGSTYAIIPDMIEAGTYMVAAVATGGEIEIKNVIPKHLEAVSAKLEETGATVEDYDDSVIIKAGSHVGKANVKTHPYPGYPTDMQPQIVTLLTLANGVSYVTEGVYEKRFRYVEELEKMGASITINGTTAVINGNSHLHGATVQATDLRAGVAMIIAALVAEGDTIITDVHLIERGYDDIVGKLRSLGANIEYLSDDETEETEG